MANTSGNAYGLTTLIPIRHGSANGAAFAASTKAGIQDLPRHARSPMATVPNTWLCRFYVLDDVFFQGQGTHEDHLQSSYIVFSANFYGDADTWLAGMWEHAGAALQPIFAHCVAFDGVSDSASFVNWMRRCQVKTTFYFNGSSDETLDEQLKGLYLKQEFTRFVYEHQGLEAEALQSAFRSFANEVRVNETFPRWRAGSETGEVVRK